MGQINTAIGMFSAAARLAPKDARFRAFYGQALATNPATRRLAEAELQVALKLDPENGDYRTMLAELYRDLGFAVRARSEVEKVLKDAPNHQKARELLRSLRS
jgi:predicted Zn-dependent protease